MCHEPTQLRFASTLCAMVVVAVSISAADGRSGTVTETPDGYALRAGRLVASFRAEGMALRLEGGASWSWRLSAVGAETARPAAALPGVQTGPVRPTRGGEATVDYARGRLVERYVARPRSVEQRFVIPAPLSLGGDDLVIAGEVTGPEPFAELAGGWRWGKGPGAVRLGEVTVVDAAGRRLPAELAVSATATRLTVDGAALASAAYPVTVDPEIGPDDYRISATGPFGDCCYWAFDPDLAYNPAAREYLVVWAARKDRWGEEEIYGQRLDATTGRELGEDDFRISDMGPEVQANLYGGEDAAVAYNSVENEYLVVWSGDDGPDPNHNAFEVYGQRIDGITGAELGENDFRISDMDIEEDGVVFEVAVAYNPTANEYLVVWDGSDDSATHEIFGQRIDGTSGAEIGENDFQISRMGPDGGVGLHAWNPAVVYNPVRNEYLVVWGGANEEKDRLEIHGQRLDGATGAELGEDDFRISRVNDGARIPVEADRPDVAHDPDRDRYLVVWDADWEAIDPNTEIYGRFVEAGGVPTTSGESLAFRISDMGPDRDRDSALFAGWPKVAYDPLRSEFLVIWYGNDVPFRHNQWQVHAQRIDAETDAEIGANDFQLTLRGPEGNFVDAVEPNVAFDPAEGRYLMACWGTHWELGDEEIYAQFYAPGLFEDDFQDGAIASDWSLPRGIWSEEDGHLVGRADAAVGARGTLALATGFEGCTRCRVTAELTATSPDLGGEPAVAVVGWHEAPDTQVLVTLETEADLVRLVQRRGGDVVAEATAVAALEPDVLYRLEVAYDAGGFRVALDDVVLIEEPAAAGEPFGRFGLGSRDAGVEAATFHVVGPGGGSP